jgi:hypothetical protein
MSLPPGHSAQLLWAALEGNDCWPSGTPEQGWRKCPGCRERAAFVASGSDGRGHSPATCKTTSPVPGT